MGSPNRILDSAPRPALPDKNPMPYEIQQVAGKGDGLVARVDIAKGTRILTEKPLLVFPAMPDVLHEPFVAESLKALPKEQQRQFLSLHNNFPGKNAFSGIVKTNALPCGPGSNIGAIYSTICLINHSCRPNSHNSWNSNTKQEAIHAIKDLRAGEEITICYTEAVTTSARQQKLKQVFGFDCACPLCSMTPQEIEVSDKKRSQIQLMEYFLASMMMDDPAENLKCCKKIVDLLDDEYGESGGARYVGAYYDAFRICVAEGDLARAAVFAEYAYEAKVMCAGEDCPEAPKLEALMKDPSIDPAYAIKSKDWKTAKDERISGVEKDEFEKWLWRE